MNLTKTCDCTMLEKKEVDEGNNKAKIIIC